MPSISTSEKVSSSPLAAALSGERLAAVYRVLETLSDKKRVVFVMHDLQGVPAGEIAKVLDTNVLTVRTRLFYARKEFYERIRKEPHQSVNSNLFVPPEEVDDFTPAGITALTTPDGRVTALMPHPERVFRSVQLSYHPDNWRERSPWLRMFENARRFVG